MPAGADAPHRAAHAAHATRPRHHHHHRRPRRHLARATAGVLGELLITAAALFALFFVWQTWWTDHQAHRQADQLIAAFHDAIGPANPNPAALRTDAPPPVDPVAPGQTIGVLIVPRWDGLTRNAMPILEGTTPAILDRAAAGHYPTTQQIGEIGNAALAGHRRTHGNSFRYLDRLHEGDQLIIETATTWYVYDVTGHDLVLPSQWQVVAPVPRQPDAVPTERLLTLTTCHSPTRGEYGNTHRWVTHARLTGWLPRTDGTPEQVRGLSSSGS